MTDLEKLIACFNDIGIEHTVRADNETYSFLFIGPPQSASDILWMDDNFSTTRLDLLLKRNKFMEFESGKLASY